MEGRGTYAAVEVPHEEDELALADGHVAVEEGLEGLGVAFGVVDVNFASFLEGLFGGAVVGYVYVFAQLGEVVFGVEVAGTIQEAAADFMVVDAVERGHAGDIGIDGAIGAVGGSGG